MEHASPATRPGDSGGPESPAAREPHRGATEQPWSTPGLDRRSSVPLYYQLQELIHQQIASGRFQVGDALPAEGELCHLFGVSRIVVRQALQVLQDDGEVVRLQGKGTFVTEPKIELTAGGLVRVLNASAPGYGVEILDAHHTAVEDSIATRLGAAELLRVDWLLRLGGEPMGIAWSFLRPGSVPALQRAAIRGARLGNQQPLTAEVELDHSEVSVSTSNCSPRNAQHLGVAARDPVFLVDVTEIARGKDGQPEAIEIARVIYRSDTLSLQLEATTAGGTQQFAARLSGVAARG